METQVRTPQMVFMQPQRLIVPLFQRPYVWNKEIQWGPLWRDVVRVTERLLAEPAVKHQPHFLGAVVIQQLQNPVGSLQVRTIIDGQQRLTTLQVLLDALSTVNSGGTVLDPDVVEHLLGRNELADQLARLSGREREVLELIAQGLSNRAIADRLVIDVKTVETHIARIMTKLDLHQTRDEHRRVLAVLAWLRG